MNTQVPTSYTTINHLGRGQVGNAVGTHKRHTFGGPTGGYSHQHTVIVDVNGDGHTSAHRKDGHVHKIINGEIKMQCPPGKSCHSHNM